MVCGAAVRSGSLLGLALLAAITATARDKPENWVEVRSPHFTVVSNAPEKHARRVADQLERMRSIFKVAFPAMQVDPAMAIVVLAVKDEKDFRALEPEAYLGKGRLELAGLFLPSPEKNYILMRLDARDEDHPYSTIYHEYTHLLSSKGAEWLPLWLNEGLAEFYQNTQIQDKDALLGQPDAANIMLLRQNSLLPLATLFAVDHTSPYYHESNKGSIFYAEAWVVTHYLMMTDRANGTHRLMDYLNLVSRHVDATTAAQRAFGDLVQLQKALAIYIQQSSFNYFKMTTSTDVDDEAFKVRLLTEAQAQAVRADFLAYNRREQDARSLLDDVLREDAANAAPRETMGYLEFRRGNIEAARKWYEQAVKLDSTSYLAHYYFAAMSMHGPLDDATAVQVESSLRAAVKLNPSFAPAYDCLATFYAMRHRNLDEAHMLELQAVQLDPGNFAYRLNTANLLLVMQRPKDAVAVAHNSINVARSPEEAAAAERLVESAEEYAELVDRQQREDDEPDDTDSAKTAPGSDQAGPPSAQRGSDAPAASGANQSTLKPPVLRHRSGPPQGPRHAAQGVIKQVQCSMPAVLELKLTSGNKVLALHSENYFGIVFTASNFTPDGEMNPCHAMQGMQARIVYAEGPDKSGPGQIVSIELSKQPAQ